MQVATIYPESVGRALQKVRVELGLSISDISSATGIAASHVWKIEAGRALNSLKSIFAIATALGIPIHLLLQDCISIDWDCLKRAVDSELLAMFPPNPANQKLRVAASDFGLGCSLMVAHALLADPAGVEYPTADHRAKIEPVLFQIAGSPLSFRRSQVLLLTSTPISLLRTLGLWTTELLVRHGDWMADQIVEKGYHGPWAPQFPKRLEPLIRPQAATSIIDTDSLAKSLNETLGEAERVADSRGDILDGIDLIDVSDSVNPVAVPAPIESLIARLRLATVAKGKKTELAKSLGMPLVRISQWLSGSREPGGDTTLRLLEWVRAEEAKAKTPSGAVTPPGAKTRSRKSSNEKPESNPQKT